MALYKYSRELEIKNAFLKKLWSSLLKSKSSRALSLMLTKKVGFSINLMLHILEVSRSSFYSWLCKSCPEND
jgi:hypothetical protein